MKTIRIVNYAVNGGGVGHLVRLIAINRWIRRYAAHAGVKAEIWFLTSSEADGLLFSEKFASFKLPSKSVVGEAGIDKLAYLALAKQWVWHSLGLLRPDLLVVDTFPRGSFGELLSALDLAQRKAFVFRPTKDAFSAKPDFQAMLPLYDAIVVPEHRDDAPLRVPDEARGRVRWTGPVMARERVEAMTREEARARLGVASGRTAVWISAGGGGDPAAEAQMLGAIDALEGDRDLHLVVGAGPLYRGRVRHGERITWLGAGAASEWMAGFDVAVSAAGYNSFNELMHAGVPCVFLPQEKIADEQAVRAQRAVRAGAAVVAESGGSLPNALADAVARFEDPAAREAASRAARALVPQNHARAAAAELLRLVLPSSAVEAAEEAVGDRLLVAARALGAETEPFVELMRMLDGERPGDAGETSDLAVALLELLCGEHRVAPPIALKLLALLSRKLPGTPAERAKAMGAVADALAPFGDWAGATVLLKVFGTERELGAAAFARELAAFLDATRERGEDLYAAIAALTRAQTEGAESNAELLRRATGPIPLKAAKKAQRGGGAR